MSDWDFDKLAKEVLKDPVARAAYLENTLNRTHTVLLEEARGTDTTKDPVPEGVQVEFKEEYDAHGEYFYWNEWVLPTLGEPLYVDRSVFPSNSKRHRPVVVCLAGKNWEVHLYDCEYDEDLDWKYKGKRFLKFEPTDAPATSTSDWPPPEPNCRHFGLQLFGQPTFAQWPCYPSHEGKAAYLLWNRETGRGDIEIENVFIALDEFGLPCRAWVERSMH